MKTGAILVSLSLAAALTAQVTRNQDVVLKNWPAPLYWQPSQSESSAAAPHIQPTQPQLKTDFLVFVAITPCRVVDTRANAMFPAPFGTPSLAMGPARDFPIQSSTQCSIPSTALAYSFNVTVIPPGPLGYLILWPTGQAQPTVVTLDDIPGDIRNNAAIVPAGTPNGSISAVVNGSTDLVIDINGYFVEPNLNLMLTGTGMNVLSSNTIGVFNTGDGYEALLTNTTGNYNTAMGAQALYSNKTGSNNTALGFNAGYNTTGSNNIDIGNQGAAGDNNVIRIGASAVQLNFFAAGVRGVTTGMSDAVTVMIDSNGQLGTVNSSRRFKEDIQDMDEASSCLLRLRPVTYRYQKPYADGSKPLDYGLIAEEVAEVYPDLVVKNADGQIETVQYHKLIPLLLNELQKLQAKVAALEKGSERKAGQ